SSIRTAVAEEIIGVDAPLLRLRRWRGALLALPGRREEPAPRRGLLLHLRRLPRCVRIVVDAVIIAVVRRAVVRIPVVGIVAPVLVIVALVGIAERRVGLIAPAGIAEVEGFR